MLKLFLVFSLLGLFGESAAQFLQNGQCDENIQLQNNFDIEQFLGEWYEITRSANSYQGGDCSTIQFTRTGSATTITVQNSAVNQNFLSQVSGTAAHTTETARLTLTFPNLSSPVNFWILSTDYANFALGYSCVNVGTTQRQVYIWQLGRQSAYPNEMIPALMATTLQNLLGINVAELQSIDHSDAACYVLPVIQPGQPIILPGQCDPDIAIVQNFDVARFTGVWHEIASYESENAQGSCPRAEYTLGNNVVNVVNSQVVNQALDSISGTAVVSSTDGSARLSVTLEVVPGVFAQQELLILATNYQDYAVSYTCVNQANNQKRVYSWIVSRTRELSAAVQTQVDQVINSYLDLNNMYFQQARQSDDDCFYYPTPIQSQAVVFRGQCDLNIPAMPNFDPARYMGLWHDIESYPTSFQDGTCSNAEYTLVDGRVDVYNTQVVNRTLDTINGIATIASTDGSAKLLVSFPISGTNLTTQTDYWVLNTDYITYSLVYSCRNLDSDSRLVTAWKLSRTKSLPAAAWTAINNIMNTINVLDQRYFEGMDQSREGCFYIPEPRPGVPVVFPGLCDETISVVQNFNFQQFQGTWNEIEAYPKDQQTGQCINHQFTATSNTVMNLVSSSVSDQFLGVTNGVVTYSSSDLSAKLTITITVSGSTITIPYWVLLTDYTSYALAYSCVNLNDDFRAIYSWKLSRTPTLSAVASTTINNAIANIEVLGNEYYETIDQSASACFYLPELAPGEPVILDGQCDVNIRGVANFNAARYLGVWRLIEGYPSESQLGTCEEANYSLNTDGSVTVLNSEVVNQTLVTITGTAVLGSTDGTGKLDVTFPGIPGTFEYYILDTDYDSYALVYGCVNLNSNRRRVWSWKMSRTNTLTQTAVTNINQVINTIEVLNNRFYQTIDRSYDGCFYFPTPSNNAVVFRGQCDENIPVVVNFNAAQYMGLWHDIESYPAAFQDGTCGNAQYTLTATGVDVYNTQVINQTLDTINGVAVLATTDGSAKLLVTFPVGGTSITTNYWVLTTDYVNYALVYSCANINAYYKQVSSWKLSRTKALTAASTAVINNAISNIQVLDQRYFLQKDQSREGCFYFPEPQQGVPVVFPGQCDESISVVQNFDLSQFQGLWHEIQAYPKEEQSGQCINHQFTVAASSTLNLQSSNVNNQTRDVTNGVVSFISNDTSARLTITINVDGTSITIPYSIIATDYNNYALAYSCVNINSDFRGVWSWKLSRTQQLSTASNTAINNAISNIDVIDQRYFEDINQSDDACFYLPDLGPGEPVEFVGQCDPNIAVVANFDAARYLGRWSLVETYASAFQLGSCNDATYTLAADGSVNVYNTEVINETLSTIDGTAIIASTDGSGKLLVTFPDAPPIEYWILDTDYTSYSFVYSCSNLANNRRRVWSWKLSRTNSLTQAALNSIAQTMSQVNVLDDRYFEVVDRSAAACFYYPTPDGTSVVFRGQCDESIPVVTNFDAARYMGLWHDVESYPAAFQDGTCGNAQYTLTATGVDVYNTQVINQTLDTINGVAVLATTDGSAKLLVTFPVGGTSVTTNYWVLATDYTNYALVYSCFNIDSEYRRVSSWKLSRTKTLTTASTTAINNVVDTIQVLDQRYFIQRDQTPQGCFYFPEPKVGVPVVFPGQCNENIAVVQNFDLTQFQGLWHEIQAYPKEEQSGQCINHQFTVAASNTLNLQSSNVNNQTRDVTNGVVSFISNDMSARLTITINVDGTSITIPYSIIATDYTNYALAYSCVNINSDFRGVWSWKLSRTQQLSTASNTAINNAISNIDVIDQRYFEDINQSDDACFYLPDLGPGEPVEFVGQCDPNIAVVANFNAARYLGRWSLIETYASAFQLGSCNDATYTLAADGSVNVYNTEVINETLSTIDGTAVIASTDGSGKLLVTFPDAPPIEYWILDTDYTSYSFVYSCSNLANNRRRVWSWKLSRTNSLTQAALNSIAQTMSQVNVLDDRYFEVVDRSAAACFYYPTPDGTSVVFRGQCDESIPVVTNFDAARYMGLWHDVESYPAAFQDGTCGNAQYTLTATGVDVYNTQVINQTLDTINGVAVLATTDGSAKLLVTFPVGGTSVTTNYWVLATDYTNYALVYSCFNIDSEYRRVSSWKLSRTKTLTTASTTAINNVVDTIQVLDQRYFIQRDQTPQGCFYFPEPKVGVPVVFPGQCNENIAVVQNFDLTQFQGLWHEIQAYPKEEQSGQCINHQFTVAASNTLNLQSSNVNNQTRDVTNGVVSFISNDMSARLTITINVDGTSITIPYSIIATDYTNYALAYSCVNINSDFRGVWSWKLSRTQQLSTASNTAINNAISNIDVIDQRYFEDINQSDDACFYLPDLGPGEPVEFVGQCDPNIAVVANFDAARYLGRWSLVETYASAFQLGSCNDATYTLAADGSVNVYNTEVINETLSTIDGTAVIASTDGSGKLLVTFPDAPPIEYWILDTDYTSYSFVYSCSNLANNRRRVWSWKLSRTNSLTQAALNSIAQTMSRVNVLDDRYFEVVDRSAAACFYYPTPDGNSVVFRGQCDENIPVVANFNAALYEGRWHDIQSYPAPFQRGTCNNALYTLNDDGTVDVYNTQVVEQLLDTMSGTAIVVSNDGSAKLSVTFPSRNSTAPYWVLATDYVNYALVYSCQNIDAEHRRVFSWKLSRQQTLSAASITSINAVINNVQVLRQDYYLTRGQSEEDCFYYPDNLGGDVILGGQCADNPVNAVTNFNPNAFTGTWHEAARFPSALQDGECAASEYALASINSFTITQTIVLNERQNSVSIPATISTDGRGILTTTLSSTLIDTLYILDTDYTEYALTFGCRNYNTTHKQIFSWKLSRSRDGLSTAASNRIDNVITNTRDLHQQYYRTTGQSNSNCFYYPVFDRTPAYISLPGPCDETITGVSNFDAAAYLGVWNEIERYPQPTQFGQCDRAEYSLGTNVVDVSNTLVSNQTLYTQLGSAEVTSTDGSGLLSVTFNVNGVIVVANYYVLATDYTNYAFVYNCRNLDNGWRQVGSWKLSRTTSLSIQANEVITRVIGLTEGLLDEYYLPTSQSDEDCFYIPEVDPNRAPLFRGQCEDITGVQGFDIERYLGWWHEIERYPSDSNVGECISSQYQTSDNQIQVVDTSVIGDTANVVSGNVVVTANNTLVRTLSNGQQQEIAVLATDYDTYSLLYSCENVGTEYRRVWSAKHSKTRQLSQAAQNAMESIVNDHQLLYPQFYQIVDQRDSACFHYPEQNGNQVILPGQCDDNIPVVQNFDASAYAGTWYQIQKYDPIHESGTCIGARYTLDEATGVVDVLNWEVIDGTLETINGTATVVSSDGSARLSVILPVIGTDDTVTTPLYVLTSDYESYSLAYSCVNINAFQRSIGAWKLSRTREMTATGNTAINAYMATREELHQPYFRAVEQSDDCEEPSSALLVKSSIIVIFMCVLLQIML